MKAIAITHKGFEDICSHEIKELIGKDSQTQDSVVLFESSSEDLCKLCYLSQSSIKILSLLGQFKFKTLEDIKQNAKKLDLKDWLKKNTSFVVDCKRIGEHDFNSQQIEKTVGETIYENYKNKVDLEDADLIIFVYIFEDTCYIGIDFAGFNLSKRQHKIFTHPKSLKGTIAYSLVRLVDYAAEKTLLDPFCTDGSIVIEAAFFASKFPVQHFNKDKFAFRKFINFDLEALDTKSEEKLNIYGFDNSLGSIKATKSNAKIAGVHKLINAARVDTEWLDTKLEEKSVDCIITRPPIPSKIHSEAKVRKIYKELFYQLDFVLKNDAKLCFIARNLDALKDEALKSKFKIDLEKEIAVGKDILRIAIFSKYH